MIILDTDHISVLQRPSRPLNNRQRSSAVTDNQHPIWIAKITPVAPLEAGRVICWLNILPHTLAIVILQAGFWPLLFLAVYLAIHGELPLAILVGVVSTLWMMFQIAMPFVYPEWPINLRLCNQLRRCVGERDNDWREGRIVELVPRERWRKTALETATDLLLFELNEHGVYMNGDYHRYELPCESILGADVNSVRPRGWFCEVHFVLLYVHTDSGVVELPIAYRDHHWGSLRSRRRLSAARDLAAQIQSIARGAEYQPLTTPKTLVQRPPLHSNNPYAAPACIDESA